MAIQRALLLIADIGGDTPSSLRRVVAWTRMTWRSLPYMLKLKQPCTGFRNFDVQGERVAGALQP